MHDSSLGITGPMTNPIPVLPRPSHPEAKEQERKMSAAHPSARTRVHSAHLCEVGPPLQGFAVEGEEGGQKARQHDVRHRVLAEKETLLLLGAWGPRRDSARSSRALALASFSATFPDPRTKFSRSERDAERMK